MKLGKEIKYWGQILQLPIYGLLHLIPRDKKLWVFGSTFGRRFADNPKYLYLYISQNHGNHVRAVWISRSREIVDILRENCLEAYYLYSFSGFWNSLRAGVYFYDNYTKDISYVLSGGALKINLWHGIPLKKIQKDNIFDYYRNPRSLWEWVHARPRCISDEKPSHYILTTSQFIRPVFETAFRTKRVLTGGYPRNDILISDRIKNVMTVQERQTYEMMVSAGKENKIILYMPTFRDSEGKAFDVIDMARLKTFLERERYLLCVKLHPKSRQQAEWKKQNSKRIRIIDAQLDPYCFLQLADILLTDYSSIYFDFLFTNKPIIFFPYDYKEYLSESRELYFEYGEYTPGTKVYCGEELEKALLEEDRYSDARSRIRDRLFDTEQYTIASERLFRDVAEILR
ncbi:CDP-glycerol glycerophosphotransferase (TagB/SpsB family) [Anaerotaenia torta]|uniref:CDP-glycerol glycerophosphotransferase family protein n=1 Tax=Anaerotaenia torta TaxID=433293 RepID=UPI003D1DE86E